MFSSYRCASLTTKLIMHNLQEIGKYPLSWVDRLHKTSQCYIEDFLVYVMECGLAKKYEKVDSFLKRFLAHSRYTGVRLIEPCIAVSSVYNKQFKFVVLADEWLYVTENPPKVAKDIQEVTRIVDIISVELVSRVNTLIYHIDSFCFDMSSTDGFLHVYASLHIGLCWFDLQWKEKNCSISRNENLSGIVGLQSTALCLNIELLGII